MYDGAGHLLGEYAESGTLIREHLWLEDLPLASFTPDAVYLIQADHLNTPTSMTDLAGTVVWRGTREAFGETEVTAAEGITQNLRFPGQYFDQETGLHQNWNREYDPNLGRYMQSDPRGLFGGSLSTFAYGASSPLIFVDPAGLAVEWKGSTSSVGLTYGIGGQITTFEFTSECKCDKVVTVKGFASFLTIGASAKISKVPIDLSGGGITMYSKWSNCPAASDFNGFASAGGINVVAGVGGSALSTLVLGNVRTEPSLLDGPSYGVDVGLTYSPFGGASAVYESSEKPCCSN